ncbi:MAG: ribosome small subunit-dependent GTPase A [Burkholderiaceae bacterium]|nr:ribosome small subunit-dependent GTPase A [Burkholderiaceae bacterium]
MVGAHGRHFVVEVDNGSRLRCHRRGKKVDCVVGDRVAWSPSGDEGVIESVHERRNLLLRQDRFRTKAFAANLDRLLFLVAVQPMYAESQLARALIAAAAAGIDAQVVLNKIDLPGAAEARDRLLPYRRMGVAVHEVSLKGEGEAARRVLSPLLADKTTLLLGPSGMGKSTLINLMVPGAEAQVGEISAALNTGRHTTTTTSWYWLDAAHRTGLIDSPGFQEYGLQQIAATDLPHWMPDLGAHAASCRFTNCTHRQEPDCGVRAALERGEIAASRHRIYEELYAELTAPRY